jgi:TRAP-type mannitol/chloroaromatic compound transport system permease small subunit
LSPASRSADVKRVRRTLGSMRAHAKAPHDPGFSTYNPPTAATKPKATRLEGHATRVNGAAQGGRSVNALLAYSRFVDAMNERVGRLITWLVLAAVLVSAINATVRKVFNYSSNAYLEAQWYMFSAIFLLCAAWTLQRNEHIRIDVVAGRLSKRTQTLIDVFGTLFFLLPMVGLVLWQSIPWAWRAWVSGEVSASAGGLILWPAKILVPIGFVLLGLQGLSELFKRIAYLNGKGPDPTERFHDKSAEEQLAEELRKEHAQIEEREAARDAADRKSSRS